MCLAILTAITLQNVFDDTDSNKSPFDLQLTAQDLRGDPGGESTACSQLNLTDCSRPSRLSS